MSWLLLLGSAIRGSYRYCNGGPHSEFVNVTLSFYTFTAQTGSSQRNRGQIAYIYTASTEHSQNMNMWSVISADIALLL